MVMTSPLTLTSPPTPSAARATTRAVELVTPSGIRLWHVEDYTVPLLSLEFAFLGGASQDPVGATGLTNLMASLLDEGAGDMPSHDFQDALEDRAIELSYDAGRDRLEGALRSLSENVERAFELLALTLQKPRFDEDAIERVKAQISSGLKRDESDPSSRAREALNRLAFPGHPYGNPVEGRLGQFDGLTRAALLAHHGKLVARSNLFIASVGAISAEALIAEVERAFGPLPEKAELVDVLKVEARNMGTREIIDLDVPQSTLYLALPGLHRTDPDYMAAMVLNHILGGGSFTSRLWTEVREKRGLAYSVWSMLAPRHAAALFMAGTATSNERVGESLAVILEEIAVIAKNGATADELEKAKRYLMGSYALRFDTSRKIASQLLEIQIEDLGIDYIDRRNSEVAAVTLADMARAAQRLFAEAKPLVVVAGRPQNL
jgi:zinc protease